MQRYFVYLKYDGTGYHGWQSQPNGKSVQGEVERGLSTLLRKEIQVVGAGRTDAGVHARMMVAHFDFDGDVDCVQLAYKLDRILPQDISVDKVMPVGSDMHARFSAVSRTYRYYIYNKKNPFLRRYACELRFALDFDAMNEAAALLLEYNDFGAFCKSGSDVKTTFCDVTEACWTETDDGCWCFTITADRFLRNMVRAVVGTLVEVGRHRITKDGFREIIEGGKRGDAGDSVPGHALFLERIEY